MKMALLEVKEKEFEMYDILLINPINHYGVASNPLGLQILTSICKQNNYNAKLLDLSLLHKQEGFLFTDDIFNWIEEKIKQYPAKYYGISVMNGTFIWGITIAKIIKKIEPESIVFVGGPQATALKKKIFDVCQWFDYCLLYEGETTIVNFLAYLEKQTLDIPCNVIKKNNTCYRYQLTCENINNIPAIDYSDYYNARIIDVEVGRGCPYSCYYCSAKSLVGHNIRYKNIECILQESQNVYNNMNKSTRKYINFNHDNFLSNRKNFKEFVSKKINENYNFPYGCEGRIDAIDDEIINDLSDSNCVYIFVGLESGSKRIQKIAKKNLNLDNISEKIKKITSKGIFFETNFIIGFPEETLDDLYDTIKLASKLAWLDTNIRISYSFMSPEPGSEVFEKTSLENCLMVKTDGTYLDLEKSGFNMEKFPTLYFNHLYTIKNPNYDVLYYVHCASIFFPMLYKYQIATYIMFNLKHKNICKVFEQLDQFSAEEEAILFFYEKYKGELSLIEQELIIYEINMNRIFENKIQEYSQEYSYSIQKIYREVKQDKRNFLKINDYKKSPTKIVKK